MTLAPIALFVYRRPDHVRRTLRALAACPEFADSPLCIYCDGPKTPDVESAVREARRVARELAPAHATIVERSANLGLARSIIEGVEELTAKYGKVIVVEDDLEVAPSFLRFLNAGLERYAGDERVMQVSGYQFPVQPPLSRALFMDVPTSWGWATWRRAWQHFDARGAGYTGLANDPASRRRFDLDDSYPYFEMLERQRRGDVDSWAILWYLSMFVREGIALFPPRTLVRNTGFDGTHGASGFTDELATDVDLALPDKPAVDRDAQRRVFATIAEHTARTRTWKAVAARTGGALSQRMREMAGELAQRVPPAAKQLAERLLGRPLGGAAPSEQALDVYWDPKMAELLETWGIGNAWNEIQLLLVNARGRVLDIACGTGKVMSLLAPYPDIEVHGFDISDFLIGKAIDRGIPRDRLRVADATRTDYADDAFDYGYSIGSLEHFTDDGILAFMRETHRVVKTASFHQIPTSRSGKNEGWLTTLQSYHNNSVDWWLERFHSAYATVHVFESAWNDKISVGKWFVCVK